MIHSLPSSAGVESKYLIREKENIYKLLKEKYALLLANQEDEWQIDKNVWRKCFCKFLRYARKEDK